MARKLTEDLRRLLRAPSGPEVPALAALRRILTHFECVTGTLHLFDPADGTLALVAQVGIPESLLDRVRTIPMGKGMAGLAAERREPVQVCNLQSDASGVARPRARETLMGGSITVPVLVDGVLRGTLGIAKASPHEFDAGETAVLVEAAAVVGSLL